MSEGLIMKNNFLITVAYRATRPFEQGKPAHSERANPFFCASAPTDRSNAKHYEIEWGNPFDEGENGHPFFLVYKHRVD